MADLSPEEVGKLATEAGVPAAEMVAALKAHGHTIQGEQPQQPVPDTAQAPPPMAASLPGAPAAAAQPQPQPQQAQVPMAPPITQAQQPQQSFGQQAVGALPSVGGFIGGFAGPLGAGIGGTAGEIAREAIAGGSQLLGGPDLGEVPETTAKSLMAQGKAGAEQAAYELAGRGAGKLLERAAQPLMHTAVGLRIAGAGRAAATALKEKISVTPWGFKKLMNLIGEGGQDMRALAQHATMQGGQVHPVQILSGVPKLEVPPVFKDEVKDTYHTLTYRFLKERLTNNPKLRTPSVGELLTKGKFKPVTASDLLEIRQQADDLADPVFKKIAQKERVMPHELAEARWWKALGDESRRILKTIPADPARGFSKSFADLSDREAKLIVLKKGMGRAAAGGTPGTIAARFAPTGLAIAGSQAIPGTPSQRLEHAGIAAAAANPWTLSHLALLAQHPSLGPIIANLLRAGGGAMQAARGRKP